MSATRGRTGAFEGSGPGDSEWLAGLERDNPREYVATARERDDETRKGLRAVSRGSPGSSGVRAPRARAATCASSRATCARVAEAWQAAGPPRARLDAHVRPGDLPDWERRSR